MTSSSSFPLHLGFNSVFYHCVAWNQGDHLIYHWNQNFLQVKRSCICNCTWRTGVSSSVLGKWGCTVTWTLRPYWSWLPGPCLPFPPHLPFPLIFHAGLFSLPWLICLHLLALQPLYFLVCLKHFAGYHTARFLLSRS